MREPSSRHNGSSGRARLASLRLKRAIIIIITTTTTIITTMNTKMMVVVMILTTIIWKIITNHDVSKSSRLRKRLQAAKEEDQDAKYFI